MSPAPYDPTRRQYTNHLGRDDVARDTARRQGGTRMNPLRWIACLVLGLAVALLHNVRWVVVGVFVGLVFWILLYAVLFLPLLMAVPK